MVVRRIPSSRRTSSRSFAPSPISVYRRLGYWLGSLPRRRLLVRLVVSKLFPVFDQPPGAPCGALRGSGVSSSASGTAGQPFCGQHRRSGLSLESGGHSLVSVELSGSGHLASLQGSQGSFGSPVHSRPFECSGGFPQSPFAGSGVRVDPVLSCFPGSSSSVASEHRPFCDGFEQSAPGVLLANGRPAVSEHGFDDAAVGRSAGFRLPSFQYASACSREGQAIQGSGAHLSGSVLASAPLVSRPSGAFGGCPSVPSMSEGSTQTASLPSFPPEPPRASSDCVSYLERSARAFGFTPAVARQLARCKRSSTRVNYQAKWFVYRAWCGRHGHSVSRPTVQKVASFILYLLRSLSLSYSSIASYRSMLSVVFRLVPPELSPHFVLRDLLRSFRLERLFLPLGFLLGTFLWFSLFFGVLLLSPCLLALLGTLPGRFFFCCLWLPLVGLGSFRLFRLRCLLLGMTCFSLLVRLFSVCAVVPIFITLLGCA